MPTLGLIALKIARMAPATAFALLASVAIATVAGASQPYYYEVRAGSEMISFAASEDRMAGARPHPHTSLSPSLPGPHT